MSGSLCLVPPSHGCGVLSTTPQQWIHPNGEVETGLLGPDQSQATPGSALGSEHQGSERVMGFPPYKVSGPEGRGEKSLMSLSRKWEMLDGSVDTGQRGSGAHVPLSRWVSEPG